MSGNTIGKIFRLTTFGESHGIALGGIIDGVPPKIPLTENDIQIELNRRKPGSNYTSPRKELDKVKILSGVFNGFTTGTSIGIIIENNDFKSEDYNSIKDLYRPGHADFTYEKKYGIRDYRGGGRSSARETVIRVAAGSIAKKYLKINNNINIKAYLSQIGNIKCKFKNWDNVYKNQFFCSDLDVINDIEVLIQNLIKDGNSIGAKITIVAENVPIGLGEPVFDRLDSDIAHSLMSINAVKGIEIGDGFSVVEKLGTENRDEIFSYGFNSNHSGGILGGISTGQNIIATIALKPTSSISTTGNTINKYGEEIKISVKGRHDPCVGIRAVPIAEAMMSIVIMDHLLRYRAQCGDI